MTKANDIKRPLAIVIEDDKVLAEGYGFAIDEAGYDCVVFNEGSPALELLAKSIPALIVLDLNLPDISGEDILNQVRADERMAATRVVILSADSTWANVLGSKANFVLHKPVGYRMLSELVSRFLN